MPLEGDRTGSNVERDVVFAQVQWVASVFPHQVDDELITFGEDVGRDGMVGLKDVTSSPVSLCTSNGWKCGSMLVMVGSQSRSCCV